MVDASLPYQSRPWERVLSAVFLLGMAVSALYMLFAPILVAGLLVYGILHRRRPFVAFHAMQAALWSTVFNLLLVGHFLVAHFLLGVGRENYLIYIVEATASLVNNPAKWPQYWAAMSPLYHNLLLAVLVMLALNLLLGVWGVIITATGRVYRVPVIRWCCHPPASLGGSRPASTPAAR